MTGDRRASNIERLKSELWDVLIVGGGINGAGIARDLALRNTSLKVALIEKNHFASGTSGRNSQLIHGGLRYLKYFDIGLVQEALRERATLLRIAPQLVRPLQFLLPCATRFDALFSGAGLTVYDALSGSQSIGRHYNLSATALHALEPALAEFRSAFIFMDAAVHSARLVLENILDAQAHGVCVANYVSFNWQDKALFDNAVDMLSGESFYLRARRIVDATGAWSQAAPLRLVRGSHLIFPRIQSGHEAIAYFEPDGRIVFLIPWGENNDLTLVGTTDQDHNGGADSVHISEEETAHLRSIVARLFPSYRGEPVSSYSSLRPLIAESGRSATATSREHRIWETADGVLHISGGKYTTYRSMSEELVDMLLTSPTPCRTAEIPLSIPALPEDTRARVAMAVGREFARKLPDLLYTSTYWGHERKLAREWLEPLAHEMAGLLGWDEAQTEQELTALY